TFRAARSEFILVGIAPGLVFGIVPGLVFGRVLYFVTGFVFGLISFGALIPGGVPPVWLRFLIAQLWLSARSRLPLHLMRFLDDAVRRGVLRHRSGRSTSSGTPNSRAISPSPF